MSLAAQRRQSLWRPRQPGNANPESNSYVLLLIDGGGVLCRPNIEQHCSFIARTRGGRQTNIGWGGEGVVAGIGVISGALVSASSPGTVIFALDGPAFKFLLVTAVTVTG